VPVRHEDTGESTAITREVNDVRLSVNTILAGDCVVGMQGMPGGSVDLVFADPPFNIDYEYDTRVEVRLLSPAPLAART
jgi:DNA modification methylase